MENKKTFEKENLLEIYNEGNLKMITYDLKIEKEGEKTEEYSMIEIQKTSKKWSPDIKRYYDNTIKLAITKEKFYDIVKNYTNINKKN